MEVVWGAPLPSPPPPPHQKFSKDEADPNKLYIIEKEKYFEFATL